MCQPRGITLLRRNCPLHSQGREQRETLSRGSSPSAAEGRLSARSFGSLGDSPGSTLLGSRLRLCLTTLLPAPQIQSQEIQDPKPHEQPQIMREAGQAWAGQDSPLKSVALEVLLTLNLPSRGERDRGTEPSPMLWGPAHHWACKELPNSC